DHLRVFASRGLHFYLDTGSDDLASVCHLRADGFDSDRLLHSASVDRHSSVGSKISVACNHNRHSEVPGGIDSCGAGCLATLLPAEQTLWSLSGSGRGGARGQTAASTDRANAT